jgi:biotin carboxyl carrier protein
MLIKYEVISHLRGMVESVLSQESSYVYEGESLFVIRTAGRLVHISAEFNGVVTGLHVQPGDEIIPGMILAHMGENTYTILMGSD